MSFNRIYMDERKQETAASGAGQSHSINENVRDLTEASRQLFDAGKQITENLNEITERVEAASDRTSQILKSPWLLVGATLTAGILILSLSGRQS